MTGSEASEAGTVGESGRRGISRSRGDADTTLRPLSVLIDRMRCLVGRHAWVERTPYFRLCLRHCGRHGYQERATECSPWRRA